MLTMRGRNYGSVFLSSGTVGFTGEGYPHHKKFPWSFADFTGATPVFKTVTVHRNDGNMPLREDGMTPVESRPACIWVSPVSGTTLNAVGLSNFGIEFYLPMWKDRRGVFGISVMSIKHTAAERITEMREIARILKQQLPQFIGHPFLEINFSCPNVGLNSTELIGEVTTVLELAASLGIPLIPNFSVEISPAAASAISNHPACDALSIANTVKFGHLPNRINWRKLIGTEISPLAKFGGGGMSGPALFPLLRDWLGVARATDYRFKPLIVGGGIFSVADVKEIVHVGWPLLYGIKLASVGIHRPWRVRSMIECGQSTLDGSKGGT